MAERQTVADASIHPPSRKSRFGGHSALTDFCDSRLVAPHTCEEGSQLPNTTEYADPERFEESIQRYEAEDAASPPPTCAIVCVGSSSMGVWHEWIQDDLAPLTVIPRGFGGSNMNDALHYVDRIVISYRPRAIVLYEGDNDLGSGIAPETIAEAFRAFFRKVHDALPECRIYVLSVKPSIKRWHLWKEMKETNSLISAQCAEDERLTLVDVGPGMMDDEGKPRKGIFREDDLHMKREGYETWRDTLRPILLEAELQYE